MTPPLRNSATRRADQRFFCSTEKLPLLDLLCLFLYIYKSTWMHHLTPICSICLAGLNVFCLASVNKSLNSDSLAALLQSVMQQRFAVIAAFSYAAVFDLMKNVNRQAGYVTQCMVSARLVIGLKTEPHWVCDLTRTCDVCLNLMSHVGG